MQYNIYTKINYNPDRGKILSNLTRSIVSNDTYIIKPPEGFIGMEKVTLEVNVPQPIEQLVKRVTIDTNTQTTITPDEGYDTMDRVIVTTQVNNTPTLQQLSTYILNTYTPSGFDGYDSVEFKTYNGSKYEYLNTTNLTSNVLSALTSFYSNNYIDLHTLNPTDTVYKKYGLNLLMKEYTLTSNGTYTNWDRDNNDQWIMPGKVIVNVPIYSQQNNYDLGYHIYDNYSSQLPSLSSEMGYSWWIETPSGYEGMTNVYPQISFKPYTLTSNGTFNLETFDWTENNTQYHKYIFPSTITVNVQPNLDGKSVNTLGTFYPTSPYVGFRSFNVYASGTQTHVLNTSDISPTVFSSLTTNGATGTVNLQITNNIYKNNNVDILFQPYTFTSNGTYYNWDKAYDFNSNELWILPGKVVVNVQPNLETWTNKRLQSNGTFTISNLMNDSTKDGINKTSTIVVDVPQNTLTTHTFTSNGTYNASDYSADGFSQVTVNVSGNSYITVSKILYGGSYYNLSGFTYYSSQTSLTITNPKIFFDISHYTNGYCRVRLIMSNVASSYSITVRAGSYVKLLGYGTNNYIDLCNSNNNIIQRLYDSNISQGNYDGPLMYYYDSFIRFSCFSY